MPRPAPTTVVEFPPSVREIAQSVGPEEYLYMRWRAMGHDGMMPAKYGRIDHSPGLLENPELCVLTESWDRSWMVDCWGKLELEVRRRGSGETREDGVLVVNVYLSPPANMRDRSQDDDDDPTDWGKLMETGVDFLKELGGRMNQLTELGNMRAAEGLAEAQGRGMAEAAHTERLVGLVEGFTTEQTRRIDNLEGMLRRLLEAAAARSPGIAEEALEPAAQPEPEAELEEPGEPGGGDPE